MAWSFCWISFVYIISHPHATFIYYPLPPTHAHTHNSGLPGRSDNDVKNRWHSKMRSRSVKRKERESSCGGGGADGGSRGVVVVVNSQQQQQQGGGGGGSGEEAHGNYAAAYHNGSNRNIMMNNTATSTTTTTSQEWKKRSKLSSSMIGRGGGGGGGGGGGESSIRSNGMTWNHNTQQHQHQFAMNIDPSYTGSSPTNAFSQEGPGAKSAYGDEGVYENVHQNPICNGTCVCVCASQ